MLKSCAYCGRIHDSRIDCGHRPQYHKRTKKAEYIRSTSQWQNTRTYIRHRDNGVCQLCARNYKGTLRTFEDTDLSVHHIEPLQECEERAFDTDNLITLCSVHHEEAEAGRIPRALLHEIAKENERRHAGNRRNIPPVS